MDKIDWSWMVPTLQGFGYGTFMFLVYILIDWILNAVLDRKQAAKKHLFTLREKMLIIQGLKLLHADYLEKLKKPETVTMADIIEYNLTILRALIANVSEETEVKKDN